MARHIKPIDNASNFDTWCELLGIRPMEGQLSTVLFIRYEGYGLEYGDGTGYVSNDAERAREAWLSIYGKPMLFADSIAIARGK